MSLYITKRDLTSFKKGRHTLSIPDSSLGQRDNPDKQENTLIDVNIPEYKLKIIEKGEKFYILFW